MAYEPLFGLERTGVQIEYHTSSPAIYPVHWHSAIELIYILNGNAMMMIDGTDYPLIPGEFVVIDSNQMHKFKYLRQPMMITIHFSRSHMKNLVPLLERYYFHCTKETMEKEQLTSYLKICDYLKTLAPLYIRQPVGYKLKSHAVALDIFFELLCHFSCQEQPMQKTEKAEILNRLSEITEYIEEHHAAPLSLEQIATHFFLSREYFSRFFKKNMGVTFTRYLNQVRLMHIYQDICNTNTGIMELAEQHGFTNYKLFNKMFHEIYGCAPRDMRQEKAARSLPVPPVAELSPSSVTL